MLVGALQVQIGGIAKALLLAGDCGPAGAGVEPHIHGVGAFAPLLSLIGIGGRQQINFVFFPPHIGTVFGDQRFDVSEGVGVEQDVASTAVVKDGDRHTPGALT